MRRGAVSMAFDRNSNENVCRIRNAPAAEIAKRDHPVSGRSEEEDILGGIWLGSMVRPYSRTAIGDR